jgi:hypothetical protein
MLLTSHKPALAVFGDADVSPFLLGMAFVIAGRADVAGYLDPPVA